MPEPIDEATPKDARTRTGFDGNEYELVFSDEFEVEGRTFWPGEFFTLLFLFLFIFFSFSSSFHFILPITTNARALSVLCFVSFRLHFILVPFPDYDYARVLSIL